MGHDDIPVARLMTAGILTVGPNTALTSAAGTMVSEDVSSLVVVDDSDQPVGMFTTTDLATVVSDGPADPESTVAQYMTAKVVSIRETDSIVEAAAKMILHGVHHLPVSDAEGKIVGMLSSMDLASHYSYAGGSDMV